MNYKTLHRKLKFEQHESHLKPGVNSCALEGTQFLLHQWHPSCYSYYISSDKSLMRKGQGYDKVIQTQIICDSYPSLDCDCKTFRSDNSTKRNHQFSSFLFRSAVIFMGDNETHNTQFKYTIPELISLQRDVEENTRLSLSCQFYIFLPTWHTLPLY